MIDHKTNKYIVYTDDNFHFMDESERYCAGEYETEAQAIAKCKEIVDRSLKESAAIENTPAEIYKSYTMYGDDPFIIGPTKTKFSAWEYAKQRCIELNHNQPLG